VAEYPVVQQKCYCSYIYGDWSPCNNEGQQTRNYSATPTNCYQADKPVTARSCAPNACKYVYSAWSACNSSGARTRTYSATPTNCVKTEEPITEQKCTICVYIYGEWSLCNEAGVRTRTVQISPENCYRLEQPVVEQKCVACSYIFSDWSNCFPPGVRTRMVTATPTNCYKTELPVTEQKCANCVYAYSDWSDCADGKQRRMILSRTPSVCYNAADPVLTRNCVAAVAPAPLPPDAPAPVPASVLAVGTAEAANYNGRTSNEWQKYYFGEEFCQQQDVCGGLADPDKDGLSNNEEYRFGTNPKDSDTDNDGYVDGDEIQTGRNPLVAQSDAIADKMVFENAKDSGEIKKEILQVNDVKAVPAGEAKTGLKIIGKAPASIYVTLYIYSSDPVVLTVKTDDQGNWEYILDRQLEEGEHQVYVAVNDNTGKIAGKSNPIRFVQTAQAAVEIIPEAEAAFVPSEVSPTRDWFKQVYWLFAAMAVIGLVIAVAAIGTITSGRKSEDDTAK